MDHQAGTNESHDDLEMVEMSWCKFGATFLDRHGQKIKSFQCFHTGTTTSVKQSTARTTRRSNLALVMESDSGEYFVAISKAQGCDEIKGEDPNFIGWVRRYVGPLDWEVIDRHVDQWLEDVSGALAKGHTDETPEPDIDDETLRSHLRWRELVMSSRQNDKGERGYVYGAKITDIDYTLLNKGARFLQTGLLETWNPPRATVLPTDEQVDVKWIWFDGVALHFSDHYASVVPYHTYRLLRPHWRHSSRSRPFR